MISVAAVLLAALRLVALALATPAVAQVQWTEVSKARNGDVWMMESSTARRVGDSARVWVLVNHALPVTHPAPYSHSGVRSFRSLFQIECKEKRARRLEASHFSQPGADGRLLATTDHDDWFNVPPDTPYSELMKTACELPVEATSAPAEPPAPPAPARGAAPVAPRARPPGAG